MDIFTFVLWFAAIIGSLTILSLFLWLFGVKPQTKRLIEESRKLQLKLNQIKSEMGDGGAEDFVSGAIGAVGIDGLIDALGIPAILKPVAKGFVDNLLKNPEKLKALAASIGVKLPDEHNQNQGGLL